MLLIVENTTPKAPTIAIEIRAITKLLFRAKKPTKYNEPQFKVEKLEEIWKGKELNKVRHLHNNQNHSAIFFSNLHHR